MSFPYSLGNIKEIHLIFGVLEKSCFKLRAKSFQKVYQKWQFMIYNQKGDLSWAMLMLMGFHNVKSVTWIFQIFNPEYKKDFS